MGTSGNRKGFKIFSINTTIRNPKRNFEFLSYIKEFDGMVFDEETSLKYFEKLIRNGIYKFMNVPDYIRLKWENEDQLSTDEINRLIEDNPQATRIKGRVKTQIRSLKDQGFLIFEKEKKGRNEIVRISRLGNELLEGTKENTTIYTKAFIGLHAFNPSRDTMYNKSRPFLNTLFVIDYVRKKFKEENIEFKGILRHEFALFVLAMKDCDYKTAAENLIKYRKKFGKEVDVNFIKDYFKANNIENVSIQTLYDYVDDVFRKFEMTGLISKRGKFKKIYINFSDYNLEKINTILETYKNYKFEIFKSKDEYDKYLYDITLPWESNELIRRKIAKTQAKYLGREFNENIPLDQEELQLARAFGQNALSKNIEKYSENEIYEELLILSKFIKKESKLNEISEPLRLEFLLALALCKNYGLDGVISNIIYNENGEPLSFATGNKCDMQVIRSEGCLILEPTMISSKQQQLNSETSNIARHARQEIIRTNLEHKVIMVAPKVHLDVIDYFNYASNRENIKMLTLTINRMVGLFRESNSYKNLLKNIDNIYDEINGEEILLVAERINNFNPDLNKKRGS